MTDHEHWGDMHLKSGRIRLAPVVLAAADVVVPPREPSSQARLRMIEAAGRALAERRKTKGLLPVLLKSVREGAGLNLEDVARESRLPVETISALEYGETPVDLRLDVDSTVA